MKLISLSDFVLQTDTKGHFIKNIEDIRQYAEFLQTELELSMFLPNDLDESQKIRFENVSFDTVNGQEGVKFYRVGHTQVFNLSNDDKHLYWHHDTIESLLTEYDESIEFTILP